MSDGVLSQEEIDALLKGGSAADTEPEPEPMVAATVEEIVEETPVETAPQAAPQESANLSLESLTPEETDAIGEVANIVMGSAATALSSLVGQKIDITTPNVRITTLADIRKEHPIPYLLVNVEYSKGIQGRNVLIIKNTDAAIIADLMMGGDGSAPPKELSEMQLSAVGEAMNQMMGSSATSMSQVLKRRIDISPPTVEIIDLAVDEFKDNIGGHYDSIVCVSFKIIIEGLIDSEMMQLIPLNFAREMARELLLGVTEVEVAATAMAEQVVAHEAPAANFGFNGGVEQNMSLKKEKPLSNVTIQPAQFSNLNSGIQAQLPSNIDLIMDVPLQITVELGKTRKTIREILSLGPGSVVELDKLAGEPVDLLVNGKLLAKGEVVVIDENFGIRVTDIISPIERVTNLQ